jgi:hypothetical protein
MIIFFHLAQTNQLKPGFASHEKEFSFRNRNSADLGFHELLGLDGEVVGELARYELVDERVGLLQPVVVPVVVDT